MTYVGEANTDRFTGANDEPFCCRCHEEFPVSREPASWRKGHMRQGKPYHRCHIRLTFGSAVFPGFLGAHARSTRSKVEANASEICNLCCGSV